MVQLFALCWFVGDHIKYIVTFYDLHKSNCSSLSHLELLSVFSCPGKEALSGTGQKWLDRGWDPLAGTGSLGSRKVKKRAVATGSTGLWVTLGVTSSGPAAAQWAHRSRASLAAKISLLFPFPLPRSLSAAWSEPRSLCLTFHCGNSFSLGQPHFFSTGIEVL